VPVVLVLLLAACTSSTAPSTTTKQLPVVDLSATPGWVPVAYGDAQVSVPASFKVYYPGWLCEPRGNALTLGPPTPSAIGCPSSQGKTMVNLSHIDGATSEYRAEKPLKLNGVALYLAASFGLYPVLVYYVPSIGVEVTAIGPLARRIVDTLTRSPRVVALAAGLPRRSRHPGDQ
jgi:hypothetical protein